jgi:hypothetical protein
MRMLGLGRRTIYKFVSAIPIALKVIFFHACLDEIIGFRSEIEMRELFSLQFLPVSK